MQWREGWGVSQQADYPSLPAGVAINVALGGLDRSVPGKQLHVAQAASTTVDVSRRGRDEGSPAGVRRASLEAELFEPRRKPVDHAGLAQTAATGGADDGP